MCTQVLSHIKEAGWAGGVSLCPPGCPLLVVDSLPWALSGVCVLCKASCVCLRLCHRVRWVSRREGVDAWNSSVGRHPLSSGGRGHNPPRCEQLVLFVLLLKAPLWGYRGPVCPSNSQLRLAAEAASWSPQEAQGTQHARSARPSKLLQSLHLPGHVTPSSRHRSHFIPRGADWQVEEALAL